MAEEKRMAGSYQITQSLRIGEKEIVLGINDTEEYPFFCAYYSSNEIIGEYSDCLVSKDYAELLGVFAQRIQEESARLKKERSSVTVPSDLVTAEMCYPNDYGKSIVGKVVAIRPDVLLPEYRAADRQLWLCTGGFGACANSRGSACFCTNLYSGKETRWERAHILGEVKELPDWAKERLTAIQAKQRAIKEREAR